MHSPTGFCRELCLPTFNHTLTAEVRKIFLDGPTGLAISPFNALRQAGDVWVGFWGEHRLGSPASRSALGSGGEHSFDVLGEHIEFEVHAISGLASVQIR